jgi:hypothetical protein
MLISERQRSPLAFRCAQSFRNLPLRERPPRAKKARWGLIFKLNELLGRLGTHFSAGRVPNRGKARRVGFDVDYG